MKSALIVWFSDGKQKFKFCKDQESFEKEMKRIRNLNPPRCVSAHIINWENDTVESLEVEDPLL